LYKKISHKKAVGVIDRTFLGVVSLLKETVSNDEIASRKGFLQGGDPRLKCLSIALMLLSVVLARNIIEVCGIYAITLLLALTSAIGFGYFLKRTLLFIPLFSLFIVIPAIFSVVTPGTPVVSLDGVWRGLSITRQGIDSSMIFFMRVLASVSLAILLMLTTRHHVLLKVLRIFKVPQLFVMTMGMTYRYIYLLLDIVQKTFIAVKSRVGSISSTKTGRGIVTANMAGLWLKSYRMQNQVYDAMLSRGYTGEPRVLVEFHARPMDFIMFATALMALIGTLWINRFFL
jgi:cobalt/nickel transport system permease protein